MKLKIYQVDPDKEKTAFSRLMASSGDLKKYLHTNKVDMSVYSKVYECIFFEDQTLDTLFATFNFVEDFQIPNEETYKGHSLSVSDVIEIEDSHLQRNGFYFVDDIGFSEIIEGELIAKDIVLKVDRNDKEEFVGQFVDIFQDYVDEHFGTDFTIDDDWLFDKIKLLLNHWDISEKK